MAKPREGSALARFWDQELVETPGGEGLTIAELFEGYRRWCRRCGFAPMAEGWVLEELVAIGKKIGARWVENGVSLALREVSWRSAMADTSMGQPVDGSALASFWNDELVEVTGGEGLTSSELYDGYLAWCQMRNVAPLAEGWVLTELVSIGKTVGARWSQSGGNVSLREVAWRSR